MIAYINVAHYELTNDYQNLAQVTVTAPSNGFVVLTGSGYIEILNPVSDAWIGISIGKISSGSNHAETGIQLPLSAPAAGTYRLPFSLTTVVSVLKGDTTLYMVGTKDSNPHTCYANALSLTALFDKEEV
jgi:hypothetical protein